MNEAIVNRLPWLGYPTSVWEWPASPSQKLVWICLWSYARRDGDGAFPSIARLAKDTGLCEKTVRTAILDLETIGYVRVERTPGSHSKYFLSDPGNHYRTPRQQLPDTPVMVTADEMPSKGCQDENPPNPPGGGSSAEVLDWWNGVAEKYGLKKISKLSKTRLQHYRARVKDDPEFQRMVELALPKRKAFFRTNQQPTFDQAVRESYFDQWIRDLGWEDPGCRAEGEVSAYSMAMRAKGQAVIAKAKARETSTGGAGQAIQ